MLKKITTTLLLLVCALLMQAQKIQVIDSDGNPIAYVCVTDKKGALVGSTDTDGWLENTKGNSVLNFSHIAFEDMTISVADIVDGRIVMQEVDFNLPQIEVKPKQLAYVQTYYRLIYFDEDGPIYYRGGVIDNTYEFAKEKTQSKTRSLSKGKNGFLRFLISTFVGRYIDKMGQIRKESTYQKLLRYQSEGKLSIAENGPERQIVSDTVSTLGYIDTDTDARLRTTSFDVWAYNDHVKATEAAAKAAAKGKQPKEKEEKYETQDSYYEVYRIDEEGRSRIDDFVMRQLQVNGRHKSDGKEFMILLQAYTTDRDYVDKKDYKQLRNDNKVDMDIRELKQFEQAHKIPPLAPNVQNQIDKLFEKDLNKK